MTGRRFADKVVLITGAARGMGRSHTLAYAREGASVIALDAGLPIETAPAPTATPNDLQETARLATELGAPVMTATADIRDFESMKGAADAALERFGKIDVVVANAGIAATPTPFWEIEEQTWRSMLDVNLTGAWHTVKATVPSMIEAGAGGSIVLISSVAGLKGVPTIADYVASKHGIVGLMRTMAQELAPHTIRANTINPTNVWTPMFDTPAVRRLFSAGDEPLTDEDFEAAASVINLLPVGWVQPEDVTAAVLWITSDEARYVTGVALPVDAGCLVK
jgi:SDR family mycofactocin-dependent oxidoreductase